jgi:CheY-like chemotaxis protein
MDQDCVSVLIALADDDADESLFIQEALKASGISFCLATVINGMELMEMLTCTGSFANLETFRPDFILLDVNMPLQDGITTLAEIRSNPLLKEIPVFMISVSSDKTTRELAERLGADDYFVKPGNIGGYEGIMSKILGSLRPVERPIETPS